MRAISLWQPWATAMALDLKRNETRDWRPSQVTVPFQLAIHAAKHWNKEQREFTELMRGPCPALPDEIPLGALIAVCTVVGFERTEKQIALITDMEANWGNYEAGRWAWVTEHVRPLAAPIPWKGKQGFFYVPDEVVK